MLRPTLPLMQAYMHLKQGPDTGLVCLRPQALDRILHPAD